MKHVEDKYPDVIHKIEETKALDDATTATLEKACREYAEQSGS